MTTFVSRGKEEESFVFDYYSFANLLYAKSDAYSTRVAIEKIAKSLGSRQ